MNRRIRDLALALGLGLALVAGAAVAVEAPANVPVLATNYLGEIVYLGDYGQTGATTTLRVHVDRLTAADEAARLNETLYKRGEDALASELGKQNLGFVQIGERFPERIQAAFLHEQGNERHLTLITQRPWSVRESFANLRSADYRFRVIQLDFDLAGKGAGEMLVAARLEPRLDGTLDARNLDVLTSRVLAFRALTK
jgi:hypothetical protein